MNSLLLALPALAVEPMRRFSAKVDGRDKNSPSQICNQVSVI
jgi:hypothetical protein